MATIIPVAVKNSKPFSQWQYNHMKNGDSGAPISLGNFVVTTMSAIGTWGAGGAAALEVSYDNGGTFTDYGSGFLPALGSSAPGGSTSAAIDQARPHVTGGDSTTDLTVTITANSYDYT